MHIKPNEMPGIQKLVGPVTASNLKYVDCYVSDQLGIFIPSVGFCEYAIRPQHTHPGYSFLLLFSPEQSMVPVEISIQAENYLCLALSPAVPHEEEPTESFKRYAAIMIDQAFYETQYAIYCNEAPPLYDWQQFQIGADIMFYVKQFMAEYENQGIGHEKVLTSLAAVITHQIIRNLLAINIPNDCIINRFDMAASIEYMHQHYGEKLSVKQLANLANMSESNFIRVFKQETGLAPMEYLINTRLDKAKKLLRSGNIKITTVALQCGFNSSSHFSTCFAKHLGMSPSEYQHTYSEA